MELQFGKGRRYVFSYHQPNMWTARPSREAGQIIDPANHRLRCGGADAIKRLGVFSSTKADAVMHHNRVEFRMALPTVVVKPQVFVESIETVEAPPEPATVAVPVAVVTAPMSPAELVPFVAGTSRCKSSVRPRHRRQLRQPIRPIDCATCCGRSSRSRRRAPTS